MNHITLNHHNNSAASVHASPLSEAEQLFAQAGISFALYGMDESTDRLIPQELLSLLSPTGQSAGVAAGTLLALPTQSGTWGSFAYFAA